MWHTIVTILFYMKLNICDKKTLVWKSMIKFNVYGSVHSKYILIYIQQDAMLHSLLYPETDLHISGGTTRNM
jgi:hypothetical protein